MSYLNQIYARLPVAAQHGAVSAYGLYWNWLRFGAGHADYVQGYQEREKFSAAQWSDWQQQRLRVLLTAAATQVPYYIEVWSESEKRAANAGQLAELPLLSKEAIRKDHKAFLRRDLRPGHCQVAYTSGSTGTPITSIRTIQEVRDSMALREARSAGWANVSFRLPRATFSGRMVEPQLLSRGPFYRYNLAERQVYLSAFHLRPESAAAYVEAFWKHRIQWLTGYAFSHYTLAKMVLEQKLRAPRMRAIITQSEKVTPEMRRVLEAAYRCRVFEEYSTVENVSFASECEQGKLHVSPDAGVVEILKSDGTPCQPGEVGEVVATSLTRRYQIFIRYRLGDLAEWDSDGCACGRSMPVIKEVVGRVEDAVLGPDGRCLVRFHGIFINQPNIREGQIVQEALDRILVRVAPTQDFGKSDQQDIESRVKQRLGPQVRVTVETVDQIPRTRAGKFKAVVSLLNR